MEKSCQGGADCYIRRAGVVAPYGFNYDGAEGISGNVDMNAAYKDYPAIIKAAGLNGLKPWYADAQAWVVEKGISDGTKHNTPVTRAEHWDALYKMYGK